MRRIRATAPLALWLAVLGAAVAWLHLGATSGPSWSPSEILPWLEHHGPAAATVFVVRVLASVAGWYLIAVTLAAIGLRTAGLDGMAETVEATGPALVRRVVRAAAGVAVAASMTTAAPAAGVVTDEVVTMRRLTPDSPPSAGEVPPVLRRLPPSEVERTAPPTRTVQPGDHFWAIAEDELVAARGRAVTDDEIDPYWRLLVTANAPDVVDPDLLFPGQVIRVPSVPQ